MKAQHAQRRPAIGLGTSFCDAQSPWQRGSSENAKCRRRQYFLKGLDLSQHAADELGAVARTFNSRLRKMLDYRTSAEALDGLPKSDMIESVAATGWICITRSDQNGGWARRDGLTFGRETIVESIEDKPRVRRPACPPTNDAAGEGVDHEGQVNEAPARSRDRLNRKARACASLGNILGSVINWTLGRGLEQFRARRWFPVSEATLEKAQGWCRRYGKGSLLAMWVPIIGDPITVAACVLKKPLPMFIVLVSTVKIGRYAVLTMVTLGLAWLPRIVDLLQALAFSSQEE